MKNFHLLFFCEQDLLYVACGTVARGWVLLKGQVGVFFCSKEPHVSQIWRAHNIRVPPDGFYLAASVRVKEVWVSGVKLLWSRWSVVSCKQKQSHQGIKIPCCQSE